MLICSGAVAQQKSNPWQANGDVKYRLVATGYPAESLLRRDDSDHSLDHNLSLRYNLNYTNQAWQAEIGYQLAGFYGDSFRPVTDLPGAFFRSPAVPADENRFFDLTGEISRQQNRGALHRLDRLAISYRNTSNVFKIGRQAVSWGNGLTYTPMDFFNPFDPAVIDTEYKAGDDMLYYQHLFDNGNDLQMVWVGRRDGAGNTNADINSHALKLHAFAGHNEFDLLVAGHYRDTVLALGGVVTFGGAIIRGDWVYHDTEQGSFNNVVANISYAWMAAGKNVTGFVEFFHNDFGIDNGDYAMNALQARPQLLERISRGELFTLGKKYLTASATIEMAPLWSLIPNVFLNVSDQSVLWQLLSQHNLGSDQQLVVALSLPMGPLGTEFGGITIDSRALPLSQTASLATDWSIYAQLAWYF